MMRATFLSFSISAMFGSRNCFKPLITFSRSLTSPLNRSILLLFILPFSRMVLMCLEREFLCVQNLLLYQKTKPCYSRYPTEIYATTNQMKTLQNQN